MPRKSFEDRSIRKLMRTGYGGKSIALTIPKGIIDDLGWREKQKVVVEKKGDTIIIKDWKK